ncbi:GNAT family N-acetyltransferase [Silvimonas amylolytica]|uniref:N-acetyltransferase n=1 Tax=Silvimonas amylolytica TaxID=449663 RepID=A0ABQ2PQS8_9NEIS|nr:GNAT family N-acetyltransferase [Silvimonas amylolytica]GGP27691.1 N-acetyltransferase [Silvimonas amylolytica]
MALVTRYASLDDLDVVAPLFNDYRVFYQLASDPALARRYLGERLARLQSVVLLAELEGVAVGFIQLYPGFCSLAAAPFWLLNDLYVSPAARGHGVARALMEKARQHALATGADRLDLSTAHTNATAQALYESLGYQLDQTYRYYSLPLAR